MKNITGSAVILILVLAGFLVYVNRGGRPAEQNRGNKTGAGIEKETALTESGVFLYFADRQKPFLVSEERLLPYSEDPVIFSRRIIKALINGSQNSMMRTISADTSLNALYITDNKTAYADFSREIKENHPGGSPMEYLSVYSIVNSLVLNVPEIETVKILIDGREAETLAGHIDISCPLAANMLIVR